MNSVPRLAPVRTHYKGATQRAPSNGRQVVTTDPGARHRTSWWRRASVTTVGHASPAVSWLQRLFGGGESEAWQPGDQLWCGGDAWVVRAVLIERDARRQWPTLRLERGAETAWVTIDGDDVVRYDPLPGVSVDDGGRAAWNGRTFACSDRGSYTVVRVAGDVTAAIGDRATYQTLEADDGQEPWISVEDWEGGGREVSLARSWRVDRVLHAPAPPGPAR